jgi:cell division control protein 6
MALKLDNIFNNATGNSLFKDKFVLQTNYKPEDIPHRDKLIEQIAGIMAPALRGERISNLFVYGQTGTGKTLSVRYVQNELLERAKQAGIPLRIEYLNCKLI